MSRFPTLSKHYQHPPTNEHIERDFSKDLHDAWLAVACLYDYLEALHKDGLLDSPYGTAERALEDLAQARDRLDEDHIDCDFVLDLPKEPEVLKPEAEPRLKRPRGALRRAIEAGLVSTEQAHKQGYMGKAELALPIEG